MTYTHKHTGEVMTLVNTEKKCAGTVTLHYNFRTKKGKQITLTELSKI